MLHKVIGTANEILERVALLRQPSSMVPRPPQFSTASKIKCFKFKRLLKNIKENLNKAENGKQGISEIR
jgi:hypothetical protein